MADQRPKLTFLTGAGQKDELIILLVWGQSFDDLDEGENLGEILTTDGDDYLHACVNVRCCLRNLIFRDLARAKCEYLANLGVFDHFAQLLRELFEGCRVSVEVAALFSSPVSAAEFG